MSTMYWSKIETGKPSKWFTPHSSATNEATPVLEGVDKLKQQLGVQSMLNTSAGKGLVIFSYHGPQVQGGEDKNESDAFNTNTTPRGGQSSSEASPNSTPTKYRSADAPHPQFASNATNSYNEVTRTVLKSGIRKGEHTAVMGNITIALGCDEVNAGRGASSFPTAAECIASAEGALSTILAKSFAAAEHVTRHASANETPLSPGNRSTTPQPHAALSFGSPERGQRSASSPAHGFVRNAPLPPAAAVAAPSSLSPASEAALKAQRIVLSSVRREALLSLLINNPLGPLGLTARLLYESHLRAAATHVLLSPKDIGGDAPWTTGVARNSLASANAMDVIRSIQYGSAGRGGDIRHSYASTHFTQFMLDVVVRTMSSPSATSATARSVPIPPFMQSFFTRTNGDSNQSLGSAARTLFEVGHARLKALLYSQLKGEPKSLLTIALQGTLAEDDGLSASDRSSTSSASHAHHRCGKSSGLIVIDPSDATIQSNAVPIHPLLFAAPAIPVFPGAPCDLPLTSMRTEQGTPYHKATKLMVDTASRELRELKGVPCYFGHTLTDAKTNNLIWGLVRGAQLLAKGGSEFSTLRSATEPSVYGLTLQALAARMGPVIKSLPPSTTVALAANHRLAASTRQALLMPGQTSSTMLLHYLKLLLKSIFTKWGIVDPTTRREAPIAAASPTEDGPQSTAGAGRDGPSDDEDDDDGDLETGHHGAHNHDDAHVHDGTANHTGIRQKLEFHGLAGSAVLSVLGGGCRFIAVHNFTATPLKGNPTNRFELQGGLSGVFGRHFYFSQLSHYDRLIQGILAKNMAITQIKLNTTTAEEDVEHQRQRPRTGSASAPSSTVSLASVEEALEAALGSMAALDCLEPEMEAGRVISGGDRRDGASFYSANTTTPQPQESRRSVASPLSAYVVRNFSTDHGCLPRLDLLVMAIGAEGSTVVMMGFPSTGTNKETTNEPNAATTAMEGIVKAMGGVPSKVLCAASRLSSTVNTALAAASRSDSGAFSPQPISSVEAIEREEDDEDFGCDNHGDDANAVSDSSSDDDLTLEEVRQGHSPCGGTRYALGNSSGKKRKHGSKRGGGEFLCCMGGGGGGCCNCCGVENDEPFFGFPYGQEPSVLTLASALEGTTIDGSKQQAPLDAIHHAQFRRHGIVKRRRTRLLAARDDDALERAEAKWDVLRANSAARHRLDRLHYSSMPRFVVDPTAQWSPMSAACTRPTACRRGFALREKVLLYKEQLSFEGNFCIEGAMGRGSAAAIMANSKAMKRLTLQWDNGAFQAQLRRSVFLEQAAARRELNLLRGRIERTENSGDLQRRSRHAVSAAPMMMDSTNKNSRTAMMTAPVWQSSASAKDAALHRLYDKLVRRERFLSLLVLAKPWHDTKRIDPSAARRFAVTSSDGPASIDDANGAANSSLLPATASDMLAQVFRYAAKCDRAARLFFFSKEASAHQPSSSSSTISGAVRLSMGTATDTETRNLYNSSIGPVLKELLLAANVSKGGPMGGLPCHGPLAIDVCERFLVGSSAIAHAGGANGNGAPSLPLSQTVGGARYRHLHNYAATARCVTAAQEEASFSRSQQNANLDRKNDSNHQKSHSHEVSIPIQTGCPKTPLQRGMRASYLTVLSSLMAVNRQASSSAFAATLRRLHQHNLPTEIVDGAEIEALGVVTASSSVELAPPTMAAMTNSRAEACQGEGSNVSLGRSHLAIAVLAKLISDR